MTPMTRSWHRIALFLTLLAVCSLPSCAPSQPATDGTGGSGSTDTGGTDTGGDTGGTTSSAIVADHTAAAAFTSIPAASPVTVHDTFHILYGHTSHGSHPLTGLDMIHAENEAFPPYSGDGALDIREEWGDLGYEGDTAWADITRTILNEPGSTINVVVWSWCGGVSENTEAGINTYLATMNQLETQYPHVRFVYMTGHLDGTGPSENLYARNNQIRDYCRAHNRILFDFADIESYDPAGTYYPDGADDCAWCDTWCATHACPTCGGCEHSVCFNCYQKGRAFWWMLARMAGWSGT